LIEGRQKFGWSKASHFGRHISKVSIFDLPGEPEIRAWVRAAVPTFMGNPRQSRRSISIPPRWNK
jgi:hypothetical protein